MTALQSVLKLDLSQQKWTRIVLWWEIRRPLYNVFLAVNLGLVLLVASLIPNKGFIELQTGPMLAIGVYAIIFFYFVIANICYTGGSIVQIIVRTQNLGLFSKYLDRLFIYGLVFSFLVSLMPVSLMLLNLVIGYLF